jgi:metallo-beta-lactamase family protein
VAAAVWRIGNYSAHAGQLELADWIMERAPVVGGLFLNHGEDDARRALCELLAGRGPDRKKIFLPSFDESFELVADTAQFKGRAARRIDDEALARDCYNNYAGFIIQLAERLEATGGGEQRRRLIARLRDGLEE